MLKRALAYDWSGAPGGVRRRPHCDRNGHVHRGIRMVVHQRGGRPRSGPRPWCGPRQVASLGRRRKLGCYEESWSKRALITLAALTGSCLRWSQSAGDAGGPVGQNRHNTGPRPLTSVLTHHFEVVASSPSRPRRRRTGPGLCPRPRYSCKRMAGFVPDGER